MADATAPAPAPLAAIALGDLAHELRGTRRVLERLPEAHLDWRPHARSFTLGQLAAHVVNLLHWGVLTLRTEGLDFAQPIERPPVPTTVDGLLAQWDGHVATLQAALAAADDAALQATWTGRTGDTVLFAMPRAAVLRTFTLSHLVHHRGQLTVYLRLLDVPLPGLYGPTADER